MPQPSNSHPGRTDETGPAMDYQLQWAACAVVIRGSFGSELSMTLSARRVRLCSREVQTLAADITVHRRVFRIHVRSVAKVHSLGGDLEGHVEKDRIVPSGSKFVPMKESPRRGLRLRRLHASTRRCPVVVGTRGYLPVSEGREHDARGRRSRSCRARSLPVTADLCDGGISGGLRKSST